MAHPRLGSARLSSPSTHGLRLAAQLSLTRLAARLGLRLAARLAARLGLWLAARLRFTNRVGLDEGSRVGLQDGEIRDCWRFAIGCSANDAADGGWTSADAVGRRMHGGVQLRETERKVRKRQDRGGRTLKLKKLPTMETEVETEMRRRRRDEVGRRYSSGEERRGRRR